MAARGMRAFKPKSTFSARTILEVPCSHSGFSCSLPRLENYKHCIRHILDDKSAPYRQCSFVIGSGRRCFRAAPVTDKKEWFCSDHSQKSVYTRQKSVRKLRPRETPEFLLKQLAHHSAGTGVPNPTQVPGTATACLDYASDTDCEWDSTEIAEGAVRSDALRRREADSELDSADSDADPLEHATVFTTEEISSIYLQKLQRLKSLYVAESKHLDHVLRESRRKYLQEVRMERESMGSIHSQSKTTPEEQHEYETLKAMARYQRQLGTHALMYQRLQERRLQATDGANYKPPVGIGCVKCVYGEGSWKCGEKSVPLSKYCVKHIMQDRNQVLYQPCGVACRIGEDSCPIPILPLPIASACVFHTGTLVPPLDISISEDVKNNALTLNSGEAELAVPMEIIDLNDDNLIVTQLPLVSS